MGVDRAVLMKLIGAKRGDEGTSWAAQGAPKKRKAPSNKELVTKGGATKDVAVLDLALASGTTFPMGTTPAEGSYWGEPAFALD